MSVATRRRDKSALITDEQVSALHLLTYEDCENVRRALLLAQDLKALRIGISPQVWCVLPDEVRLDILKETQGLEFDSYLNCWSGRSQKWYQMDEYGCNCAASGECYHIRARRCLRYGRAGE